MWTPGGAGHRGEAPCRRRRTRARTRVGGPGREGEEAGEGFRAFDAHADARGLLSAAPLPARALCAVRVRSEPGRASSTSRTDRTLPRRPPRTPSPAPSSSRPPTPDTRPPRPRPPSRPPRIHLSPPADADPARVPLLGPQRPRPNMSPCSLGVLVPHWRRRRPPAKGNPGRHAHRTPPRAMGLHRGRTKVAAEHGYVAHRARRVPGREYNPFSALPSTTVRRPVTLRKCSSPCADGRANAGSMRTFPFLVMGTASPGWRGRAARVLYRGVPSAVRAKPSRRRVEQNLSPTHAAIVMRVPDMRPRHAGAYAYRLLCPSASTSQFQRHPLDEHHTGSQVSRKALTSDPRVWALRERQESPRRTADLEAFVRSVQPTSARSPMDVIAR